MTETPAQCPPNGNCLPARATVYVRGSGREIYVLESFLRNKQAAGRPEDLADLAALEHGRDG